jgi:hypothetical protein
MSYVVDGKVRGETWIEARGIKHRLVFSVNQIKQEPLVKDIRSRSRIRTGTRVTIFWPDKVDCGDRRSTQSVRLGQSAPHLATHCQRQDGTSLRRNENELDEISRLRRHLGALVLVEQFERYAGALIDRDQQQKPKKGTRRDKITVREFARSPRHAHSASVPRPSQHPAHRALHRAVAHALQEPLA